MPVKGPVSEAVISPPPSTESAPRKDEVSFPWDSTTEHSPTMDLSTNDMESATAFH